MFGGEFLECYKRRCDDLIDVVVAVFREPSDEDDVRLGRGLRGVGASELAVLRTRDRIVRVADSAGILARYRRLGVLLAGQLFELRDTCVRFIARVVDDGRRLRALDLDGLEDEFERTIRQGTEAFAEVLVDRARIDELIEVRAIRGLCEGCPEDDLNVRVRQHLGDQRLVSVAGHGLELIGEVAVVARGAHGDATADAGVELMGLNPPLFARVAREEELVELAPDPGEDRFLRVGDTRERDAPCFEVGLHFDGLHRSPAERFDGLRTDWDGQQLALDRGEDAVLVGEPLCEEREVVDDLTA